MAHLGAEFRVSAALRAVSSRNLNCTSGSWSLSRKVILHHPQDLGNQQAKRGKVGPKLFVTFGRLVEHKSNYVCLFSLRLFVVRALHHMQVWETPGCSRKFIAKSLGRPKVWYVSGNGAFERAGGIL